MTHILRASLTLCLALPCLAAPAVAQNGGSTSRIIGYVKDADTGRPLVSAQVTVNDGTEGGALTDLDGRYVLDRVPYGTVSVTVTLIGYSTKTVTDVEVVAGRATSLDLTLETQALEVGGITVSAERERGSQAFLLDARRTSTSLVEARRSPSGLRA